MKRYLPYIPAVLIVLAGCGKAGKKQDPVIPPTPEITVQTITYPTFTNSTWVNVVGGSVVIQLDNTDASGTVLSTTKDSTDVANIASYDKVVKKGTYNITLTSKTQSAVADTFIRFNAQVKGYTVENKQAVSFSATTNDGLITISQGLVQPNKVPVFKADADGKEYKMALKNGFYYLYVDNGVKGSIVFTEAVTGQSVSKSTAVVALNQYNVSVKTISGFLQIAFSPFTYTNISAETNTLVTVNVDEGDYYFSHSNGAYFVATDENGLIIGQAKYVMGTRKFKLVSTAPYSGHRLNLFVIINPSDGAAAIIDGYLQIKKGSNYSHYPAVLPFQSQGHIKPYVKNTSVFDRLVVSTNVTSVSAQTLADTVNFQPDPFIDNGDKLYVQLLKNNKYTYNFFNVPVGTVGINIDISKVTKTPASKTFTGPVSNFALQLYGKTDPGHIEAYGLDFQSTQTGSATLYYPKEVFKEYDMYTYYVKSGFQYQYISTGATIPDELPTFDATFTISGNNVTDFKPSITGAFDYYHASFGAVDGSGAKINFYSPSAGNYTSVKLPSFTKFLNTAVQLTTRRLLSFELVQYQGFDEKMVSYRSPNDIRSTPDLNLKSVSM